MDNVKRIEKLKEEKYQVLFGIQKATFEAILAILENAYKELRKNYHDYIYNLIFFPTRLHNLPLITAYSIHQLQ
jgi:hypothetical protein